MSRELEARIMKEIGFDNHYSWFNGSGSCDYCRSKAVEKLPTVARAGGLKISADWLSHCEDAKEADNFGSGRSGLTNTWVACSNAIMDAIYRLEGGESAGFSPDANPRWYFWDDKKRQEWNQRNEMHERDIRLGWMSQSI